MLRALSRCLPPPRWRHSCHPAWQPPAALLQPRLNLTLVAQGPPDALATSAVATLGDFTLTAAPTIDLNTGTASGPVTLRNPDAIAAATIFHLNHGLAWPGAGSISLRAEHAGLAHAIRPAGFRPVLR